MLHLFFFGHDLTILDKSETCKILKLFNLKEDKNKSCLQCFLPQDFNSFCNISSVPSAIADYNYILSFVYKKTVNKHKNLQPNEICLYFISLEDLSHDSDQAISAISFLKNLHFHIYILNQKFNMELSMEDICKIKKNFRPKAQKNVHPIPLIMYLLTLHADKNITYNALAYSSGINVNTLKYHASNHPTLTDFATPEVNAKFSHGNLSEYELQKIKALRYNLTEENAERWLPYMEL